MKLWRSFPIVVLAIILSLSAYAFADGLELKPYGFVKGDMLYATGAVEKNTMIYGALIVPVNKFFSLALEVESITTSYKGGDDMSAVVLDVAGKVTF